MDEQAKDAKAQEPKGTEVEVKLRRDLGLLEITMIGLGPTIGSTIFLLVGFGISIAGPALILAFVLNFIVTIFTAMAYAELGSAFSDTGGGYLWVKDGMPQPFGFLAGWMSWFGHSIVTSFYVLGFGYGVVWLLQAYGVEIPGLSFGVLVKLLAVIACLVFIYINYRGTKSTGKSSNIITGTLVAIVIVYIIAGVIYMIRKPDLAESFTPFMPFGAENIIIAMGFTFIVFEGYEIIAQCGEECKEPEKNIPKAHWITISIATVVFVSVAIVTIGVKGWQFFSLSSEPERAMADVAADTMPGFGILLIGIGIIIGALAAINSTLFSSSRVSFAMGRDGALPRSFGRLHKKRMTPHVAIFASGAIIVMMTVFLPIAQIAAAADIMFLLLMLFVNVSVISLRYKRPNIRRRYLMPLFPLIPILGLITKGIMAVSLYAYEPAAWFIALGWIEIGLLAYYLYGGKEAIETPAPMEKGVMGGSQMDEKERQRYRILVPVVDDDQKPLVEFGALVARVEGADLHVTTVIELPSAVPSDALTYRETSPYIKLVDKLKKASDVELIKARGSVLISHAASAAILDVVKEEDVNLLVLGWKGITKEGRILGSTLDKLVNSANCDVVVFKTAGLKKHIEKILVVSTPEWHVSYATGYAILMAKKDDSEITILSVSQSKEGVTQEEQYAEKLALLCQIHGIKYNKKTVISQSLENAIISEARTHDLVVMGASSEPTHMKIAFGSLQDRVARAVKKPVLVMRKVKREKPGQPQ